MQLGARYYVNTDQPSASTMPRIHAQANTALTQEPGPLTASLQVQEGGPLSSTDSPFGSPVALFPPVLIRSV